MALGARELAAEILESSPTSVRISLQVMEETRGIPDVVDAVTYHSPGLDELMVSEDAIEGLTAFAQKRKPQWRNRGAVCVPAAPPATGREGNT